ncbi:TonB-dependent receptor plug domain-containing protein [Hymenobacter sp. CRA2]|uniref:TonB-dependent receptor plug domain-containing protein n=1 Tax=Hymenobacter sp. CRA2 TaxID=1955620 RepID=UPI0009902EC7|nr:TonB-dependent receptor plug domain-containing protein [Hymenobacter sp. CRA2]OON70123.1 hypothetical protein B0919_05125 [Hymenobacter sp. CRA2]
MPRPKLRPIFVTALLAALLAFSGTARAQEPLQATQQATLAQRPDTARPVSIRLVCTTTIRPGHEPLYVVDGQLLSQELLQTLNPNQIQKIDVLRIRQAQALYGELGRNGVVLITTKPSARRKR